MKNKKIGIYFLGRTQGYSIHKFFPSKIENRRRFEDLGFYSVEKIKRSYLKINSNILFFRNKPEKTTDKIVQSLTKELINTDKKLIINDIRYFYNYDSKDRAFKIWEDSKLLCPKHLSFSYEDLHNRLAVIKKITKFLNVNKKIILRTNNETGSLGLYVIENSNEIHPILDKLIIRMKEILKTKKDTKIICVEYLETKDKDGYRDLYRVHVLFDKIICSYVSTSKENILYNSLMSKEEINRFIKKNHDFNRILPKIKNEIIKSVSVLGNNIGAVEFFLIDNKPYFIELNPMWGGHAARNGFGNNEMMEHLLNNKNKLINKIPNIYKWLDFKDFYKNMYSEIRDYYYKNYL